ncbi:hypothetical protein INT45_006908 [Circinella minor]|uniref:RlpA-like protein double-psi beta-barrel domain-containing protein n=1 Tax=Circinella minor TaxID=1195481 RepID=A0A8H7S467_9FUNG|nr:hypothetical protein INT45_006908 [Circinella minor]
MKLYSLYIILFSVILCLIITSSDALPSSLNSKQNDKKKKKVHTNQKKRSKIDSLSGNTSSGIGTYYDTGPGSCGQTDSNDELVVAINKPQMHNGANPNNNPHCNKYVYIAGSSGESKARIVDTCPGCPEGNEKSFCEWVEGGLRIL